jgi:hypothetical protein
MNIDLKEDEFVDFFSNLNINDIDLMSTLEEDDKQMLKIERIVNMSVIDWGKTMAVSNQYIQRNILRKHFPNYKIYTTDDKIDNVTNLCFGNNSPGYDIVVIKPDNSIVRIQSKLRQVSGKTDTSKQVHFETTRRHSNKNILKSKSGHVSYSIDEFDFVFLSLINVANNYDKRKDCNLWSFCLIPIKELQDGENDFCITHITPNILKKYSIDFKKNISDSILDIPINEIEIVDNL